MIFPSTSSHFVLLRSLKDRSVTEFAKYVKSSWMTVGFELKVGRQTVAFGNNTSGKKIDRQLFSLENRRLNSIRISEQENYCKYGPCRQHILYDDKNKYIAQIALCTFFYPKEFKSKTI